MHLSIIIAFGPEIKSFIYSGLIERIASQYCVTIFTSRPESPAFRRLPESIRVLPLPEENETPLLSKWRYRASSLHNLWLAKHGRQKWQHYLNTIKINPYKNFLLSAVANQWSVRSITKLEEILARNMGTNTTWARLYAQLGIDGVITSSYASERTLPALQTALNMGLKTIIITNSWKDIHVKPHLPLEPTKILVWNDANAKLYKDFNPWMREETLAVSGSLHLESFLNRANILPKDVFYRQTGLDPDRPFLCYTAAAPKAVLDEESIVVLLMEAIKKGRLPHNPQVLIRINPMEDGKRFEPLVNQYPADLIIQRPQWEWFPEADWCCSLEEDVKLWVSTVQYAALNVSIPSTVTLEFASLGKPVVNVCFDPSSAIPEESSTRRFWSADFYSDIKSMHLALPSFSAEELIENIKCFLTKAHNGILAAEESRDWLRLEVVERVLANFDEVMG